MSTMIGSLGARFALCGLGLIACSRSKVSPSSNGTNAREVPLVAERPEPASVGGAFAPPADVTATLSDVSAVDLRWKPRATEPGGYWIEFATPGSDFVKLGAAWPDTVTFRHEDLPGATTFIYRIRPSLAVSRTWSRSPPGRHRRLIRPKSRGRWRSPVHR